MRRTELQISWTVRGTCVALLAMPFVPVVIAQTEPPPNLAKQAIDNRKAVFTLIGGNFRPIGEILRGNATYESVDVNKLTTRVAFLTGLVGESFPEISKTGDTRAKPEVWSDRTDFDKKVKDFNEHAAALSQVVAHGGGNTDAFKAAAKAVAQDCKGCHDNYRSK